MMNKAIVTCLVTVCGMLALTASCAEKPEKVPAVEQAAVITTTTTGTTTTTTAPVTMTTTIATTTTTTTHTTTATTIATTTTTTAKPKVTTTTKKTTTAAPKVTTTAKPTTTAPPVTLADGVCTTVYNIEGKNITVYYEEKAPSTPTLQAYSDLAQTGVLTPEIKRLITDDILNYAISKYGCSRNESLYANSATDYNCGFMGGARNDQNVRGLEAVATFIKWGALDSNYIVPSLDTCAKDFQASCFRWVDGTFKEMAAISPDDCDFTRVSSNVGFCAFRVENGYTIYQVSFLYG